MDLAAFSNHYFRGSLLLGGHFFWVAKTCTVHGLFKVTIRKLQQMWKHPHFLFHHSCYFLQKSDFPFLHRLQGSLRRCSLKLASKIFASVRLVLTCVDKALHGFTSDFYVLVLKWMISVVCVRFLFCCLFVVAVLIVSSIIHRRSEYINCTVTVHATNSTSWAYAVENTMIIKEQNRSIGEKNS